MPVCATPTCGATSTRWARRRCLGQSPVSPASLPRRPLATPRSSGLPGADPAPGLGGRSTGRPYRRSARRSRATHPAAFSASAACTGLCGVRPHASRRGGVVGICFPRLVRRLLEHYPARRNIHALQAAARASWLSGFSSSMALERTGAMQPALVSLPGVEFLASTARSFVTRGRPPKGIGCRRPRRARRFSRPIQNVALASDNGARQDPPVPGWGEASRSALRQLLHLR